MFVVSQDASRHGIGKLIARSGSFARVEFFVHPGAGGRQVCELRLASLRKAKLEPQTRVFFHRDDGHWRVGRVSEEREDAIEVNFGQGPALVSPKELFVRCALPAFDPSAYLIRFLTESRQLSRWRGAFVAQACRQRSVGAGLEGLLASNVELQPHQLDVVRRVLTDRVQRYLLADEVGLGKTIEAAAIIRQHVIDDPTGHRIAVIVPEALVSQWRHELGQRFHLDHFLDESVQVLHAQDEELSEVLERARMVVVDEAHRIVGNGKKGGEHAKSLALIRQACVRAESLLLLSATPAISDEGAFFELMQLIDPELFPSESRNAFAQRIAHRQEVAQIIAAFEPASMQFLVDDGQRLMELFPQDQRLRELLERMTPLANEAVDPDEPALVEAVTAVRHHLSETYRLHRRILRNRRKNVKNVTPQRVGAEVVSFDDPTAGHVQELLEHWRLEANEARREPGDLPYEAWVRLLFESPRSLASVVSAYRHKVVHDAEIRALDRLLVQVRDWDPCAARLKALGAAVRANLTPNTKLVVFASDQEIANLAYASLRGDLGTVIVARHDPTIDGNDDWQRFVTRGDCQVLVCDQRAEEGLNLQGGRKLIVHLDMPLAPNRIEQRIGRVDRFGSGDSIRSLILASREGIIENAWLDCIVSGFGVMSHSIASLQYLVDRQMTRMFHEMPQQGVEAINALTVRLGDAQEGIGAELMRIDQQDTLEALQGESLDAELPFESLFEVDDDWIGIRDAVEPWIQRGLQLERQVQPENTVSVDEVVRYRYVGGGPRATQLAPGRLRVECLAAIDTSVRGATAQRPVTHRYAYRRQTSVRRVAHLMRLGDPLFAGIQALSQIDDRGRCDAVWRHCPMRPTTDDVSDVYLRCEFLIQADLESAMTLLPDDATSIAQRRALQRRVDLILRPHIATVWLDRALQVVPQEFVQEWLAETAPEGARDTDLDVATWQLLRQTRASDTLEAWSEFVTRAVESGRAGVLGSEEHKVATAQASSELHRQSSLHLAQLQSRIMLLTGRERALEDVRLQLEQMLESALQQGVVAPLLQLDAVGVMFLSTRSLQSLQ